MAWTTERLPEMAQQAIVGEKVGMTQTWVDDKVVPVTMLRVEPMRIVQIKTNERDGYTALQVTYGQKKANKLNKPQAGHFEKAGVEPGKRLVELRLDSVDGFEVGQEITVEQIAAGTKVDVTATSRGKGFAGVMKRHNFKGAPASHGAHKNHRKPGAIGQCAFPARVFKGMRMAGHMGHEQVTTQNLEVVKSDLERNILLIKGSVPGPAGGVVIVRNAVKLAGKAS
jgi:large subunit ribosomal protein L3